MTTQYLDTHARAVGPLLRELRRLPAADLTAAPQDLEPGCMVKIDGEWMCLVRFDGQRLHLQRGESACDWTFEHVPGVRYMHDVGSF